MDRNDYPKSLQDATDNEMYATSPFSAGNSI